MTCATHSSFQYLFDNINNPYMDIHDIHIIIRYIGVALGYLDDDILEDIDFIDDSIIDNKIIIHYKNKCTFKYILGDKIHLYSHNINGINQKIYHPRKNDLFIMLNKLFEIIIEKQSPFIH